VSQSLRTRILKTVQYLVGALALAWAFGQVEWGRASALLADASPRTVVALVGVSVVGLLALAATWHVLLDRCRPTRFRTATSTGLIVLFVNQLLPSRLSGRAVAPFVVHNRTGIGYPESIAVSGVHTGLYALLYGFVALVGVGLGLARLPLGLVALLFGSTVLYGVGGALALLAGTNMAAMARLVGVLTTVFERVPRIGDRLVELVEQVPSFTAASADSFRTLSTDPGVVFRYAVAWAISLLVVPGIRVWLLFETLGTGFEPVLLLPVYLLTAYSVTLLPLTPGGIGVTEATATAVFVALGVPETVVVPTIFVDRLLGTYLPALLGWYPSLQVDLSGLVSD